VRPLVSWHPFQLIPILPREGIDRRAYLERKFGGPERASQIYERVRAAGQDGRDRLRVRAGSSASPTRAMPID
jgi:predicted DsbA family dithiol-disulfide isomerase